VFGGRVLWGDFRRSTVYCQGKTHPYGRSMCRLNRYDDWKQGVGASLRTFADVSETVIDSRGRGLLSHDAVHRSSTHFRDGAIYEMREQRLQMHLKWTARRRLRKTK